MKRTEIKRTPMKRTPPKVIGSKVRAAVKKRSRGICEAVTPVCIGSTRHVHHKKLRSQGGLDTEANMIDVCLPCHDYIHAHPEESYERGWLIRGVT